MDNWREIGAKGDEKRLQRLQRYGSIDAAFDAMFAAQSRISSGELKPSLRKDASAEEMKEWREAHGIPESFDKYDLGKDVKIGEEDKPFFNALMKRMHDKHATPDVVKETVQTYYDMRKQVMETRAEHEKEVSKQAEDTLRAEWGGEFRRNMNLIHGLLDGSGSQGMKDKLLTGYLSDGTPVGSSPEALKMLLGLALINNPTGIVVPGGSGATGEGIKEELEKLQKIPTSKKSDKDSERQRHLIDAAIKSDLMDKEGNWKK